MHIAFGQSATQISQFFSNSSVEKEGPEWKFQLEQYADYPAHEISFYENPPGTQRAGECRIPTQAATSRTGYPLWRNLVLPLPSGQQPEQCIIFLRDEQGRFHARVLSIDEIHSQMSDALTNAILDTLNDSRAGIYEEILIYEDFSEVPTSNVEMINEVRPIQRGDRQRHSDDFEEGFTKENLLETTYRNPDFARKVKERDDYTCVVCEFNFFTTYGERGRNFAECHHLVSFRDLKGPRISTLDDAVTVCANCHRMLHRGNELLTPDELRDLLR